MRMGDDNGGQDSGDFKDLASYPNQFGPTATGLYIHRQVFWNQNLHTHHSHYGDPSFMIHEKIKTAFCTVTSSPLDSVIQFWAPVKTSSGRLVLSTENQPFALLALNTRLRKYRLSCLKYLYNVLDDDTNNNKKKKKLKEEEKDDTSMMMIINGPAAAAFINHLPEVVMDHKASECPLLHIALKYDLTCSVMLPVFDPNRSCIGVVECCMMRSTRLLTFFSELKYSLECVGLSICNVYESSPPSKGITSDAIQQALHVICSSHDLPIAQVWIVNHHVPSSSNTDPTKPLFLVKSADYSVLTEDIRHLFPAYHFYNHSHILPLRIVEGGLVERTLQTGQPHFSKDIRKLKANGLLGLLCATTNCSSFVMCLRSTHPEEDNVDYVFEFLWPQSRNHIILLESMLLLTLKKCLPGFKFASGAQFDKEMYVTDADNSAQIAFGSFRGMKPEAYQEADDDEEEEDDDDNDKEDLIIVARYKERVTLLLHTDSSTLANTKEKIVEDLGLDPAATYLYTVTRDYGKKTIMTLTDDANFAGFLRILRSPLWSRIELRVELLNSNKPLE